MNRVREEMLQRIRLERERQIALYGTNSDLEDGTGEPWLAPFAESSADSIERWFRVDYESHEKPNWVRLVREEVAEAFCETDPTRLSEELIQVAALCVSWCEQLHGRAR